MNFRKFILLSVSVMLCCFVTAKSPKYVFYFIGDGMGINHVEAALTYQSKSVNDLTSSLVFTDFPFTGFVSTHSASNYITDSSAAGTALASGFKVTNNVVGIDTLNNPVYSIIYKAQKLKWLTGVITSTSIDDATPASFYAHSTERNLSYEIGKQAAVSGINFLGGAGLKVWTNKSNPADPNLLDLFKQNGYNVFKGTDEYWHNKSIKKNVLLIPDHDYPFMCLPFAIDRKPNDLSLEFLTSSAIEYFEESKANNFMLMAEGGQIDHAAHPNDLATVVLEVIDLSKSVKLAYDFYLKHPEETLIVVTADHETGGLGLGKVGFNLNLQNLRTQKKSIGKLSSLMNNLKQKKGKEVQWEDVVQLLKENLGFWSKIGISSKDEKNLKDCFTETFINGDYKKVETLYSKDEPLAALAIDIMNKLCNVGWTSKVHTGSPVPIYAIGAGAEQFTGRMDNTSIPQKIEKLINQK